MRRLIILSAWMAAILLPLSWAGKLFPGLRYYFAPVLRPLIAPEWVHVVGHTVLFAGLVLLLAFSLRLQRTLLTSALMLAIVLIMGLGQEYLQLMAKGRSFGSPEVFDLVVDLGGGLIGLKLWDWVSRLSLHPFWRGKPVSTER